MNVRHNGAFRTGRTGWPIAAARQSRPHFVTFVQRSAQIDAVNVRSNGDVPAPDLAVPDAMYILYADETNKTPKEARGVEFFLYGGLAIPSDRAPGLHGDIEGVRKGRGFDSSDSLKFQIDPHHKVCRRNYTEAKKAVVKACRRRGAVFFVAACHHEIAKTQGVPETTRRQANTVLSRFNMFLGEQSDYGLVIVDRLDEKRFRPFEYLREKFQRGLSFPAGRQKALDRILSYSMAADGTSHLASAADIVLGTFRHVINHPDRSDVNRVMLPDTAAMFWKNKSGQVRDRGLVLSPEHPLPGHRGDYQRLREHLNRVMAETVADRREALGWSQEQLASAANTSRSTVSHIETGRSVTSLSKVADALTEEEDLRASGRETVDPRSQSKVDGSSPIERDGSILRANPSRATRRA